MIKRLKITLLFQLLAGLALAQGHIVNDAQAARFVKYYNAGQPDSIYTLLSDAGKAKVPLANLNTIIVQLKTALGKLISNEYYQPNPNGGDTYVAVAERSGPVCYMSFNKEHKLTGFLTDDDKRGAPHLVTINAPGAVLKGALTVPDTAGKMPVVLIIAGSGPTDRNGNTVSAGMRPDTYLLLADSLKRYNIATLRYDKRLVGESTATKTQPQTTFEDMVSDAVACIKFLKADGRFSKIIIAGHSEGSLIGMIASEQEKVDGFISLAGAGFPLDHVLKQQLKIIAPASYQKAAAVIDSIKAGQKVRQKLDPGLENIFDASVQPYIHSLFQYNPTQEIAKVTVPTLIVQGTTDIQVSIADAISLKRAKADSKFQTIDGMSHILKEGPADRQQNEATYFRTNLPLHPELIPTLVKFVKIIK